jgi:hypothetical protein
MEEFGDGCLNHLNSKQIAQLNSGDLGNRPRIVIGCTANIPGILIVWNCVISDRSGLRWAF